MGFLEPEGTSYLEVQFYLKQSMVLIQAIKYIYGICLWHK